jgi:hypothetical protein
VTTSTDNAGLIKMAIQEDIMISNQNIWREKFTMKLADLEATTMLINLKEGLIRITTEDLAKTITMRTTDLNIEVITMVHTIMCLEELMMF